MDNNKDVENLINLLDGFASSNEGRLKVRVEDDKESGTVKKVSHLGRCDIGSPYDTGECFDAPLSDCDR